MQKFTLIGFSEIDKNAIKAYCQLNNVDSSKNYGDICGISKNNVQQPVDMLIGGTPCQSFTSLGTRELIVYRRYTSNLERKLAMEKSIKNTKDIFIIHGHNEIALLQLEKMLKEEFNLNPIILQDKPNNGLTIIEKFEQYAQTCSYAIALFTPDDIIENDNGDKYFQSRPNVIFELGWFYSHLGRSRTIILEQTSSKSDIFSDLQGIMRIQFKSDVSETYLQIQRELQSIGMI